MPLPDDYSFDILFAADLLGSNYGTEENEAELLKAIARSLIQIASKTKHRGHAHFLAMVARLFDPEIPTHRLADYPEFFIRAARRKVRFVMTTKGHRKDHHVDDDAVPRTARGTPKAEAIAQLLGVGIRQAYRIKAASKKRQRKRKN